MMVAPYLAFAARFAPAIAFALAIVFSYYAASWRSEALSAQKQLTTATAELAIARAELDSVNEASAALKLRTARALNDAANARRRAIEAQAALAQRPLAQTCDAAVDELADFLEGVQR